MNENEQMTINQLYNALKAEIKNAEVNILKRTEKQGLKITRLEEENQRLRERVDQLERKEKRTT